MKVVIATGLYPPEIGGPATYAQLLETKLPARGFEITIVPFGWVRHYPKGIRHIVYAWKLFREATQADVIYALDSASVGLPAVFVSRLKRKPLLIRLGGDYAWEQGRVRFGYKKTLDEYIENMQEAPLFMRALARLQTYVCNRAHTVIVPSKYLKSIVTKWGINPEDIKVIYSALYPIDVSGTKEELRAQLSYTHPTIVSAGRLVPWKGFSALIEAIATLREKYPEITLVIAGDGEDKKALEKKVQELGVVNNVRLVGSISKDALGASIKGADVFVLNTAYEGLSHQLIEVMDIGTPIVTTPAGGNTELITNNIHGLLVPFNDVSALTEAISHIIEHPDTQLRLTQSARGRSKDFGEVNTLNAIEELLQSL